MSFDIREIVLGPGEGKKLNAVEHPFTFKAIGSDTDGHYSIFESTLHGGGPGQHIHDNEEEAFYVIEGNLRVLLGEITIEAQAGSFILVPRGTVHTFSRADKNPVKLLVIISPAGFENFFFEAVGDNEVDAVMMAERALEIGHKYGVTFTGPPLG